MVSTKNNNGLIDNINREILILLQDNAKITINEMSLKIKENLGLEKKMSATALRARVQRLEKELIKKYMALVDCSKLGYREMVMASLRVNSRRPLEQFKEEIEKMQKIKFAYIITGDYPIFIMAKCLDHEDSMGLIENLRNLPEVEEVKTQLVLDRIKEDPTIIIP